MKKMYLAGLLMLGLFVTSCKSDKKSADGDAANSISTVEESPYKDAALADLVGDFADANYPDGEFWKKFVVKYLAGEKVEVTFSSSLINGVSACKFKGIGDYRNGYIQVPVNPDSSDPTFLTIRLMTNGDIFVGAEGGGQENPADVLQLFCVALTPTTLGGIYNRVN